MAASVTVCRLIDRMSDLFIKTNKKREMEKKKEGLPFCSNTGSSQTYSEMSDNFWGITSDPAGYYVRSNWRGSVHARISYYLTYVALTVSDRERNCACSCTFPSTEGTYLRHDPRVERISSQHATYENCMNCEREFSNLPLKNSISRSVSDDNWTSTFFNPVDPCKWVSGTHLREMRFPVICWPGNSTRRRIKNEKKIAQRNCKNVTFCE